MRIASLTVLGLFYLGPALWPIADAAYSPSAWRNLVADAPRLCVLLGTTSRLAVAAAATAALFGAVMGVGVFRLLRRGRMTALVLLAAAAATPLVLYAAGWQAWVGPSGLIARGPTPTASVGGEAAAALLHGLWAASWAALIVGIGSMRVDPALEEAALLDAGPCAVLRRITLRAARPAIVLAAAAAVAPVLTDMTITDLFVVRSFAEEVYTQFEFGESERSIALASLLVSFPLAVFLALAFRRALTSGADRRRVEIPSSTCVRIWRGATVLLLVAFLTPMAGMLRQAGLVDRPGESSHWSKSAAVHYLVSEALESKDCFLETALLAGSAAVLAAGCATVVAWRWRMGSSRLRLVLTGLTVWLWVLPGPVLAVSMIDLFNRPGWLGAIYDSRAFVVYGMAIRGLPLATLILIDAAARLRDDWFEAAFVVGADVEQQFQWIAAPNLKPSILLAFLAAFWAAATDLSTVKLLAPPGVDTVSMRLFHLLHTGTGNQQSALGVLAAGGALFVGALMLAAGGWSARRRSAWETTE